MELFTNNKKLKEQFVKIVSVGGLVNNDTSIHLAVHTLPFGGVDDRGVGSYHGKFFVANFWVMFLLGIHHKQIQRLDC